MVIMAKKGETREKIIKAAAKVFFEHGYEETSVRMIQEEANVVTGSFYHFFPSKELLFEAVIERFLAGYSERINEILENEELGIAECVEAFLKEMQDSASVYYEALQGDRLHWTIRHALHNKTMETLAASVQVKLEKIISEGKIISRLEADTGTLAAILIKGIEAIVHSDKAAGKEMYNPERVKKDTFDYINLLFVVVQDH